MNAPSWKHTADFIAQQSATNQQPQAVTTADSNQLESLLLSALSIDDSGPPQVTYGLDIPLTSSTPHATLTPNTETESTEPYRQILPGMTDQFFPTIIADSSLHTPATQDNSTVHNQITSELDKYLQEATERCEIQDNYFDRCHRTNTSPVQQEDFHHQGIIIYPNQGPKINHIPESPAEDTSIHQSTTYTSQYYAQHDDLSTIPEEDDQELDPAD